VGAALAGAGYLWVVLRAVGSEGDRVRPARVVFFSSLLHLSALLVLLLIDAG